MRSTSNGIGPRGEASPSTGSALPQLSQLLERIEATVGEGTGEVRVFGEQGPIGAVYVERGEVCWAVDLHSSMTLARRLCERSDVSVDRLRDTVADCLRTGQPLGETLVSRGVVTAEALRDVLFNHTSEALHRVSGSARDVRFARRTRSYDPRFRFASIDVLVHVACMASPVRAARAAAILESACGDHASGFAFSREFGGAGIVVAHMRGSDVPVVDILRLYEEATRLDMSCLRTVAHHRSVVLLGDDLSGTFVWRDGPFLVLGRTVGASSFARMLSFLRESDPSSQTSPIGLAPAGSTRI